MKKSIKISIGILTIAILGFWGSYKLDEGSAEFFKIRNEGFLNGGKAFLAAAEKKSSFSNPLLNIYFKYYRSKFNKRFVEKTETYSDETDSKILKGIINIYRQYWVDDFMKEDNDPTDYNVELAKNLGKFLIDNNLTEKTIDDIVSFKDIRSDLMKAIEKEGAHCETFFLNEKYDIIIWLDQKEEKFTITTPTETREIPVRFFNNVILKNRKDFISLGNQKTGGWPNNERGVIYAGEGYDIDSEKFIYSFLTHEANHFFDIEKYPNLKASAADLEYRSKLIELIYIKDEMQNTIRHFLSNASNQNRNHGHAYANFKVMHELSKIIFDKPFEGDYNKWKQIETSRLNKIAKELYDKNDRILQQNPDLKEII